MKTLNKQLTIISILFLSVVMVENAYSKNHKSEIEITKISELKNYKNTYIQGEVTKILDEDEFRLEDGSGKIKVYTGWKNTHTVKKGDKITVRGLLDPGIIKEFYASEIIFENGETIRLESD